MAFARPSLPLTLLLALASSLPSVLTAQEPKAAGPAEDPLVAVVLDEEIDRSRAPDGRQLMGHVLGILLERYAVENEIEPTEEEIDALLDALPPLPGGEEVPVEIRRESAERNVRAFKINRALYKEHGGRVIFQQFGPEPIDAYRALLEKKRDEGDWRLVDRSMADEFWRYLVDDSMHSFYPPGEAERVMTTPWWEMRGAAARP